MGGKVTRAALAFRAQHLIFKVKILLINIKKLIYSALMEIQINLDVEMAKKKISLTQLSKRIGISITNLSLLKTGKVRAIRFSTLAAICRELDCQPGDILEYRD